MTVADDAPEAVVRALFGAYAAHDRDALEARLDADLRFFSPYDNGLDRAAYLAICWPTHVQVAGFDLQRVDARGDTVFVVYEQRLADGRRRRNAEVHSVRAGRVRRIEVYFGWAVPHPVPAGGHDPRSTSTDTGARTRDSRA